MQLEPLRQKIDQLDLQLWKLLQGRMKLSLEIIDAKKASQKAVFDKEREKKIFQSLEKINQNSSDKILTSEQIQKIWTPILSVSREIQASKKSIEP